MRYLILMLMLSIGLLPMGAAQGDPYVIQQVNILPMDEERVVESQDVFISDGRIQAIHPSGEQDLPEEAKVISGQGRYLMPGLAEMHAHVPGEDQPMQLREDILFLYLSNGITLARGMLGEPWHLDLRQALAEGEITGPRLITSGPSLNGNSVDGPEDGARMVREQADAGYDFLKIHPGLTRAEFDAIAKAADEAGIPFAGHVPVDVGIQRALEAGYASIDHLDRYPRAWVPSAVVEESEPGFFDYRLAPHAESERLEAIAEATREAGVWNVPTETLMHNVLIKDPETIRQQRPEFRYLPEDMINSWIDRVRDSQSADDYDREAAQAYVETRKQFLLALRDAGAELLLGSDAPQIFNVPGFSIHHEIAIMEDAGLSRYEILRSGTVNPARFFGQEREWGQVQEGMRSELVLLRGNPLEDLDHLRDPAGVMTTTHWLDQEAIGEGLRAIEARYARDGDD
ncbi:imidazolonepropionase-like amidohydrolase [Natronospira proteinivora]|uniref:Imidazolonepropionase-like amidohydrolase n=1 Tax=Natronospira proteinivora TaxID=1807133 RepID=A0ABT1G415_9GAMM|nr:amidohydrolase family protein [Natronospira proteinivora]MCP1726041.1 imidazolonepropionase-like amidohydrolase [Natronospira proteinivora]